VITELHSLATGALSKNDNAELQRSLRATLDATERRIELAEAILNEGSK
jgi:hypothetical protein